MSKHIIVCCDGTGSMRTYFKAIHNVLPQVITMLQPIYGSDINLHIAVYHDYDNKSPRHERGGYAISYDGTVESCKQFANDNCTKVAGGGGDGPEATLTAFVYIYDFISDLDGDVLIIHCTDQAPHGFMKKRVNNRLVGEYKGRDKVYYQAEVDHLQTIGDLTDWFDVVEVYNMLDSVTVVTICNREKYRAVYEHIGHFFCIDPTEGNIRELMMKLIFQFHGVGPNQDFSKFDTTSFFNFGDNTTKTFGPDKRTKIYKIVKGLRNDDTKWERIVNAFENLLTSNVGAESVACHEMFGQLWRLICGPINKDPRYTLRVDTLKNLMSSYAYYSPTIQTWLLGSFNKLDEIMDIVDEASKGATYKFVLDCIVDIKKEELFDLIRCCVTKNFKKIRQFLATVKVVPITDEDDGVPTNLEPATLFSLLPHLLFAGTKFSPRGSFIIATLCLDIEPLRKQASSLLKENVGKWIDLGLDGGIPNVYENWSSGIYYNIFSKLIDTEFLTTNENTFIKNLFEKLTVRSTYYNTIPCVVNVQVPKFPELERLTLDHKSQCKDCGYYRSNTVMINGVCARDATPCGCTTGPCKHGGKFFKDYDDDMSNMVHCRTCNLHYAVIGKSTLRVTPKCYYCRFEGDPNALQCDICKRRFANPSNVIYPDGYTCRQCDVNPQDGFENLSINIAYLTDVNSDLLKLFGINQDLSTIMYLSKRIFEIPQIDFKIDYTEPQTWNLNLRDGREILNAENVVYQIKKAMKGNNEETCSLCYIDAHPKDMIFSCGNCNNRICLDCNKEWYGKSKVGNIICKSYLECPFCKKPPQFKIWTKAGKYLRTLRKSTLTDWDNAFWYAWCRTCNGIREAMPKECAGGGMPNLQDFQCEDCRTQYFINNAVDYNAVTMECPGCGMDTEKMYGCDHMTCVCGQHFCWACGEGFPDADSTYNHIYSTH